MLLFSLSFVCLSSFCMCAVPLSLLLLFPAFHFWLYMCHDTAAMAAVCSPVRPSALHSVALDMSAIGIHHTELAAVFLLLVKMFVWRLLFFRCEVGFIWKHNYIYRVYILTKLLSAFCAVLQLNQMSPSSKKYFQVISYSRGT